MQKKSISKSSRVISHSLGESKDHGLFFAALAINRVSFPVPRFGTSIHDGRVLLNTWALGSLVDSALSLGIARQC